MAYFFQDQKFVISCLLAILGIIVTLYIYFIERKYQQIAYTASTTKISLKSTNDNFNLALSYNGLQLNELSYTDLIIWCKGKKVINNTDIAPISPLTICLNNNTKLLDYQLIRQNEHANNFQFLIEDQKIVIKFDYLAYKHGLTIRIIHTGNSEDISVTCTLKQGKKTQYVRSRYGFLYKFLENKYVKYILSSKITSFISIIFTVFLFPIAFVQSGNYNDNNFFGLPQNNILMNLDSIVILIFCTASFIFSAPHVLNLFKSEPPKNLLDDILNKGNINGR